MALELYSFANFVFVLIPAIATALLADAIVAESTMPVAVSVMTVVAPLQNMGHTLTLPSDDDHLAVRSHHRLHLHYWLRVHDSHVRLRLGIHHLRLVHRHCLNVRLLLIVHLLLLLRVLTLRILTRRVHSRLTGRILTRGELALRVLTRLHRILLAGVARLHFQRILIINQIWRV